MAQEQIEALPAELRKQERRQRKQLENRRVRPKRINYWGWSLVFLLIVFGVPWLLGQIPASVKYEVTGTARGATITWINPQGGFEEGEYAIPFSKSFTFTKGDYVQLGAQSLGHGSVTCRILVNGTKWKESTSTGDFYTFALCQGVIGSK